MQKFCVATAYIIPNAGDSWDFKNNFIVSKNSSSPIDFWLNQKSENLG